MIASIETRDGSVTRTLQGFFEKILDTGAAGAVLVPSRVSDSRLSNRVCSPGPAGWPRPCPWAPGFLSMPAPWCPG
jgi:formate dehydrogenase (coenzyme F420) beta subunit